jgi:predicted 2-oxoglutarate/Fe(II)-dependent dioxygenase YbiX
MSSIAADLAALLSTVRRPGDFFASGTTELFAPRLEVEGVGPVALPLLPVQAEQLVAVAERAPFGRGEETLIDTQVRRTWQIGEDRVQIGGKHWARTLEAILARVADGLGVAEPIVAELYKLLIYDQGSFFVSHRDTEKAAGMFATLVVVLPSTATGGELVVRHKGREARLGLRCEDPSEAAFAAFYADCVHEVLPVTSGCRLAFVYNLLRKEKGPAPEPPSYDAEQARVAALLQAWAPGQQSPDEPDEDVPEKLIYPLEHAYTPAELAFASLKGADAAVAGVLVAAAPQSGCDLHLALASIQESGTADYADNYGSYRGRWSEPDLEAGEVDDRTATLSEWRRPDGSPSALGELPFDEEELSPPDAFDDMGPDDEEFHEATGNEGATFDRSYSRAALVLWPRERFFAVLNHGGLPVTLPYLDELTQRWSASSEDRQSSLWRQAHDLSG